MSNYIKEKEPMAGDEDAEMVSLCRKGDVDAFEVLVRNHQKKMLNIAYRMVGNYEEACEIVQDAFVSAYRGIKNFEGRSRFSTWLSTIVINLSRNRLKQLNIRNYREELSVDDPVHSGGSKIKVEPVSNEPSVLERLERRDFQQMVQECINFLDSDSKEAFILRDVQGFSYREISDMLKIAEGTVKSRLFRAREELKDCLKKVKGDL
jgi:RNA polymerase sigma-70 factor (ECF subfamily)